MKKSVIFLLIMIIFTSFSSFSVDIPEEEKAVKILPLYFFADTTAFIGFSHNPVGIGRVGEPEPFEFDFNNQTGNYETSDIYYYVQAYQEGTFDCTVRFSRQMKKADSTEASFPYSIKVSELPVVNSSEEEWIITDINGGEYVISGSLRIGTDGKPAALYGRIILSIEGNTVFEKNTVYEDSIIIECTVNQ